MSDEKEKPKKHECEDCGRHYYGGGRCNVCRSLDRPSHAIADATREQFMGGRKIMNLPPDYND